ncbi:MAG: hypothetical protein SPJ13_01340 [Bacteroidales bacterium]|nr:hypothetical protein [Bacteroidales bacterium]
MSKNIFTHAAQQQALFNEQVSGNGYKPFTTFYSDLTIADVFGMKAVKDTYKRVCKSWLDNYKYFAEFIMALNIKCWYWYQNGNQDLSLLYHDLYYDAKNKYFDTHTENKEAISYYYDNVD